jgi:hypothetical protein
VPRSKNERSYTSTPQYALMAWCSVKVQGQIIVVVVVVVVVVIIIIIIMLYKTWTA